MDPVVVGADASASAGPAVEWAARDAGRKGRPLRVVHATGGTRRPEGAPAEVLARAVSIACDAWPGLVVTGEVSAESPAVALGAHAGTCAELVVGHGGRSGLPGLLSSTGLRLAGQAPCATVVVRGEAAEGPGTVVVGVDCFAISRAALGFAAETAAASGSRLLAVYVRRVPAGMSGLVQSSRVLADAADQLAAALLPWRERHPGLETEARVLPGHETDVLIRESFGAELLVLGSRGRQRMLITVAGSVGHTMIHHAHCPVAIVRPPAVRASAGGPR